MRHQDTYIALDWLKPALDDTCSQVIKSLSHVAETGNREKLSHITDLIHQISGTLKLTELNEFLVLSETIEEFSVFLKKPNSSVNDVRDLLQATTVLRFELNALHNTKKNHSGLLYQRANYLREIMGKPRLGEKRHHAINLQQVLPPKQELGSQPLDLPSLNTLNQAWRQHTLSLLNQNNNALVQLLRIASTLQSGATSIPQAAVWFVATHWLASLTLNKYVKITQYIHVLTDLNECILKPTDAQKAETVIVDMVIQLIGLDEVVEQASTLIGQISSVSDQQKSSRIFDSVSASLDYAVDACEEMPQKVVQKLTEAKWLLEVGGWQIYQQYIQQIIDDLRNIKLVEDNKENIWKIKRQLSELQAAIVNTKQLLGNEADIQTSAVSDAKTAVLREARVDIEKIKSHFNTYCVSKKLEDLSGIPHLLDGVTGTLQMLELDRAIALAQRLQRLFHSVLGSEELEILSWPEIDAIADSVSSLEYYFDLLAQHFHDDDVLQRAEQSIEKAEHLLSQNLAAPLTKSSLADREKVMAENVIHYDDSGEVMSTKPENSMSQNNENHQSDDLMQPHDVKNVSHAVESDEFSIDLDDLGDFAGTQSDEVAAESDSELDEINTAASDVQGDDVLNDLLLTKSDLPMSDELRRALLVLNDDDFSLDEEIREIYIEEADEVLDHMQRYFPLWKADPNDLAPLTEIRRGFHTLKGSGRMVGAHQAGEVAWATENLLNRVLEKGLDATFEVVNFVDCVMQVMPHFVQDFSDRRLPRYNPLVPIVRATNLMNGKSINTGLIAESQSAESNEAPALSANTDNQTLSSVVVKDALNSELLPSDEANNELSITQEIMTVSTEQIVSQQPDLDSHVDSEFDFDDFGDLDGLNNIEHEETLQKSPTVMQDALNSAVIEDQVTQEPSSDVSVDDNKVVESQLIESQSELEPVSDSDFDDVQNQSDSSVVADDLVQSTELSSAKAVKEDGKISDALKHWMSKVVAPIPDDLNTSEDIKEIFVEEADEVLEHIATKMTVWRSNLSDKAVLADIRRGFHTLKGSGRMVGANQAGELAWSIEDMLNRVIDDAIPASDEVLCVVDEATEMLPEMVRNYENGIVSDTNIIPLMAVAKSYVQNLGIDPAEAIALTRGETYQQVADTQTDASIEDPTSSTVEEPEDSLMVEPDGYQSVTEEVTNEDVMSDVASDDINTNNEEIVHNVVSDDSMVDVEVFEANEPVATTESPVITDDIVSDIDDVSFDLDGLEDELANDLETFSVNKQDTQTSTSLQSNSAIDDDFGDDFDFDLPGIDEPVRTQPLSESNKESVESAERVNTVVEDSVNSTTNDIDKDSSAEEDAPEDSFKEVFIEEAESIVAQLKGYINANPNGGEVTNDIVRALHTLRGSAAMSGLDVLRDINHSMELAFKHLLDNRIDLDVDHINLLNDACEQSSKHVAAYKNGDEITATQADHNLIAKINNMTSLDEEIFADQDKVHVADLVELEIDDLLDAEWDLEKRLLADNSAKYVVSMLEQINRLYARVSHIPNLRDVLGYLRTYYQYLQDQPELLQEDKLIDTLLQGHQSITGMFDAMAASQRVTCKPGLLTAFADMKNWLENEKLSVIDDDFDSDLASIDAALAEVYGTEENEQPDEPQAQDAVDDDIVDITVDTKELSTENIVEGDISDAVIDDLVTDLNESEVIDETLLDDVQLEDVSFEESLAEPVVTLENSDFDTGSELAAATNLTESTTDTEVVEQSVTEQDVMTQRNQRRYETNFESDLLSIFLEEAEEISFEIDSNMNSWSANPEDMSALTELQRHLHTVKGGARMVGLSSIGDLTHEAETVYELLVAQKISATPALVRFMRHVQDVVAQQVDELNANNRSFYADKELNTIRTFVADNDESELVTFFDDKTVEMPAVTLDAKPADVVNTVDVERDTETEQTRQDVASTSSATVDAVVEQETSQKPEDTPVVASAVVEPALTEATRETEVAHADSPVVAAVDIAAVSISVNTSVQALEWAQEEKPDPEMLEIFLEEANEIVDASSNLLHDWTSDTSKSETLHALQRELHTLKGGARMAGVSSLGDLAHEMEFIYEDLALGKKLPNAEVIKVLSQSHDWLAEAVTVLETGKNPGQPESLVAPLRAYMSDPENFRLSAFASPSAVQVAAVETSVEPKDVKVVEVVRAENEQAVDEEKQSPAKQQTPNSAVPVEEKSSANAVTPAPIKRHAPAEPVAAPESTKKHEVSQAEILREQGLADTGEQVDLPSMRGEFDTSENQQSSSEMIRISASLMEKMINLSGEAAINRGRVEVSNTSLGNTIEDMGATVQRLSDQLRRMDIELEAQILAQYEGEMSQYEDFDPLEMDQYSALNQLSKSLAESSSDLLDFKSTMMDKVRETEGLLLQQSRIQTELQEGLMDSRLVPFSRLNSRLHRIIRQTANELGKLVQLELVNADSEVDRTILDRITSPLEHMLRNAVDHGVELPSERRDSGKSETGNIELSVKREGGEIVITVKDDGKGINVEAVRKKAEERGLIQNQELSDIDIMQYIFHAGLSTAKAVTQISGRGVGMDVVQSEIKQLGGVISVDSEAGKGSTFTMRLPLTVAMTDALVVRSADRHYAIPLVQIDRIERVSFDDIKAYYHSDATTIKIGDNDYRLRYLNTLLNGAPFSDFNQISGVSVPIIVVKTAAGPKQAIQIDELSGSRTEIVVKPLGNQLAKTQGVSAATILGDGSVMLILDLLALIRQAPVEKRVLADDAKEDVVSSEKTHVMVIDDSVTVRKVTTRLLERNGFMVNTAKDGVDAIEKLQEITPDVMLLDIEMPRMDGFEVASQVRNNPRLRDVPIIMITSRTGEKHRERAFELGVNCYMGKPFQEKELLENIDALVNNVLLDV